MKRILLTGKTGQVGWELERTLAPLGELMSFDRRSLDLSNPDSIRAVVRDVKPQVIVNAAAYTAVDRAESEPEAAFAINANAPAVFAEETKRLGALLVHYSTDYIFDGTKAAPYVEDDSPNPLSVYGKSKLVGEQAIRESGCNHLILRTSWVYAARGQNFLLTMLRLAGERRQLKIVNDQIGAPTWSRMIAEGTALVIAKLCPGGDEGEHENFSGVYHMTNTSSTSWHGFARAIFDRTEVVGFVAAPMIEPVPTEAYPLPAPRPRNSSLSNAKLRKEFNIALPAWDEALSMCMQEFR